MKFLVLLMILTALSGCGQSAGVQVIDSQKIYDQGFADGRAVACHEFLKDDTSCPMSKY